MSSTARTPQRRGSLRRKDWLRLVLVVVTTIGTVLGATLGAGGNGYTPPCPPPAAGRSLGPSALLS